MCVNFVLQRFVFVKNLHSWQKFYMTAGRDSRDKLQLCIDLNCFVHLEVLKDTYDVFQIPELWPEVPRHPCAYLGIGVLHLWRLHCLLQKM